MAFFAMGFHYSVLGAVWPTIYQDLGISISLLGYLSIAKAFGRVVGGFLCNKLVRKFGTFKTSVFGFSLICISLVGCTVSRSFLMLCISCIPVGFGESFFVCSLNELVALRFKAKYANWMNMIWSLANAVGPYVMTFCLVRGTTWNFGFAVILILQLIMLGIYLASYPQWKKLPEIEGFSQGKAKRKTVSPFKLKGIFVMMVALFCYIAIENVSGLWISSYIAEKKGLSENTAALGTAFLFVGMTAGRFVCGFLAEKLNDRQMMHMGQIGIVIGGLALAVFPGEAATMASVALFGFACAPVYPCFMHYIPQVFGVENTGSVMGVITGFSQIATLSLPTVFGWIAKAGGMWLYPYMQMFFAVLMMGLLIYQKMNAERWRQKNRSGKQKKTVGKPDSMNQGGKRLV